MDELQEYLQNILEHLDDMAKRTIFMMGFRYGQEKSRGQPAAHGNDFQLLPNTMEEAEKMIIELKLSGSVRKRKNGLLEFRNPKFGSVYGRTVDELREKLEQKLRYEKAHIKKPAKKKKSPLLSAFFEETYYPYKQRQGLAERTLKGMRYNMEFIKQNFDLPIAEYTPKNLDTFLQSIKETRKAQILQGLFNNIFKKALTEGVITSNPCAPLDRIAHDAEDGKALTFDDQELFFTTLLHSKWATQAQKFYYIFVYLTGTRRNEALAVKKKDLDAEKSLLHIPGTKTDGSDRYLPVSSLVVRLLQLIDADEDGKYFPFKEVTASKVFSTHIKGYRLHDLRHSFGTIQVCVNEIELKTVSLWMGHSDVNTTLRYYTHPEQLDRATFLRGDLTQKEKTAAYKQQYARVLEIIEKFLNEEVT